MPIRLLALATIAGAALTSGAAAASAPPTADVDCAAIADETTESAALRGFMELAGVAMGAAVDQAVPPFTLFVPVNEALEAIPANVLDALIADPALLADVLDHHLVAGEALTVEQLAAAGSAATAAGGTLTFAADGDRLTIDGDAATVLCGDIEFEGALIHVVDAVLRPPDAGGAPGSSVPGSSVPGSSVPGDSAPTAGFDAEQQAVATAWETAVDSSLGFDEVAPFIEDAEALRDVIEAYPAAGEVVGGVSAKVTTVTIDGGTATVAYVLVFNGVETSYGEQQATLANVDGSWVVPQEQYCAFQSLARNPVACPPVVE